MAKVRADNAKAAALTASKTTLMVYRAGLAKGVAGANHLAWEIEVGNGLDVREFVYIDAHTGKFIDQITGIHDGKMRRAYDVPAPRRRAPTTRRRRSGSKAKPSPPAPPKPTT